MKQNEKERNGSVCDKILAAGHLFSSLHLSGLNLSDNLHLQFCMIFQACSGVTEGMSIRVSIKVTVFSHTSAAEILILDN